MSYNNNNKIDTQWTLKLRKLRTPEMKSYTQEIEKQKQQTNMFFRAPPSLLPRE